jgi:hypothetical protein
MEWYTWDEHCDACGKQLYKSGEFSHIEAPDDLPDFCGNCIDFGFDNNVKLDSLISAVKAKIQENEDPKSCPKCKVDFTGGPIEKKNLCLYGGKTHYSCVIGLSVLGKDCVTDWKCPVCGYSWPKKKGPQ